jgi:excisionase family DNA binding protein
MEDRLLTSAEVAEYLQVHRQTVNRLAATGRLPGLMLGRAWRFRREDVDEFCETELAAAQTRPMTEPAQRLLEMAGTIDAAHAAELRDIVEEGCEQARPGQ